MLCLTKVIDADATLDGDGDGDGDGTATLTLSFEDRRRSRMRVRLDDGSEAALMLPRGCVLRDGQRLRGDGIGPVVVVRAALETVSVARTDDPVLLTRAAYHLGNRHVPLQVGATWLAYGHDHVLDGLVRALGLEVTLARAGFEPEAGGYGHAHEATDGHEHDHNHERDHRHDHDHHRHDDDHDHNHERDHGHDHD